MDPRFACGSEVCVRDPRIIVQKLGSEVCAEKSLDGPNPYFAHNIYTVGVKKKVPPFDPYNGRPFKKKRAAKGN